MPRVLIVTDAWHPQVNGVVRCLDMLGKDLLQRGIAVHYLTPEGFWTVPLPSYPEIRLALVTPGVIAASIDRIRPDYVHIATEGPLGLMARYHCVASGLRFTTSFHTRFPEYVSARLPVPAEWTYAFLRWFHGPAAATLVPTLSLLEELRGQYQFANLKLWTRGVDRGLFRPGRRTLFRDLPGPHLLYVGRLAVEKNVEEFLKLDTTGSKIVVGDGPAMAEWQAAYPDVHFLGRKVGEDLAAAYRSADVLVFPSRTDTFGNVILEALASGLPVAAHPVTGPRDVLTGPLAGALDEDLSVAVRRALMLSRKAARAHAETFTWARCADIFLDTIVEVRPQPMVRAA
jgi:glycosyltransferase involved in cell wall biosynthesis